MQTKSQNAQNPGLWVNGNRMPMHEMLTRDTPTLDQRFQSSARENEAAAKASWVNKAHKIGAEGISPDLHRNFRSDEEKQAVQNTQAYGSGKNLRWVDPAGVMHRGGDKNPIWRVDKPDSNGSYKNGTSTYDLETYLDNGPVTRIDLNRDYDDPRQNVISPPKNNKNFQSYAGDGIGGHPMPNPNNRGLGYSPWGASNTDPSPGHYVGTENQVKYSILDNPDAAYGTDDPIARAIRAKNDQAYNYGSYDASNMPPKGLQEMSNLQETSNKRRANYLLQVSGVNPRTPGSPSRGMRQIVKTNSGRGARLAFQGEDGQGIPANLLGGPNMKYAIAQELGVPDEIVYPNKNNYLKQKTLDLNLV